MNELPNYIAALWFAYRLLGGKAVDIHPHNRQTINRAIKGISLSSELKTSLQQKLELEIFEKLRRQVNAPPGFAQAILDEFVVNSLRLYQQLSPNLRVPPGATYPGLRVLIRDVWAPTLYLIFLKHHAYGLGNEFRIPGNWYLPEEINGGFQLPVPVLLDRWLRTTGLRTAYGITKSMIRRPSVEQADAWAAEKKKLENWRIGRVTPTLQDLFGLINDYSEEVAWLDVAESWKSRFRLAHVLSSACVEVEKIFEGSAEQCRGEIARIFTQLNSEAVWNDDEGILSDTSTYFAVRLWLKELEASGELSRIRDMVPEKRSRSFGPEISDAEIEATRRKDDWEMKLGNHIATHLVRSVGVHLNHENMADYFARDAKLREYLLSFAASKLSLIITEEAKNAGELLVPRRKPKPSKRAQSSS